MELLEDVFLPVAICVLLPVLLVWIVQYYRMKMMDRRMDVLVKAIEKGQDVDPDLLSGSFGKERKSPRMRLLDKLQTGILCLLIGAGLLVSRLLDVGFDSGLLSMAGVVFLGVGLGMTVSFFVGRKFLAGELDDSPKPAAGKQEE